MSPNTYRPVTAMKKMITLNSSRVIPTVSRVKRAFFPLFSLLSPRPTPFKTASVSLPYGERSQNLFYSGYKLII